MTQSRTPEKTIAIDIRLLGKKRTGDETVFFHLTKEILKLDTASQYRLLTDEPDPTKIQALAARLECAGQKNVAIVPLSAQNRFIWNLWTLPRYLFRNRIDVLHTQYILPLCIPKRTKIAVHIHDVSFRAYPAFIGWSDRLFLALLIPRSLRQAAIIITPSQFTKDEIVRYYGTRAEKIIVIPNAVGEDFLADVPEDAARDRGLREKYHLPERFVLYVGTLQPRKNIPFLIEAFSRLKRQVPEMKLVLVGNRTAHNADRRLDEVIARTQMEGEVIFPGFVDQADLPHIVRLAEIFAFPSLYEGFGIPLLEAMSQGVAVAASDIPCLREVGGDAAAYFDPQSLDACAEMLYTLFIDQKQKETLVRRGQERVRSFSWQASAVLLHNEYNKL